MKYINLYITKTQYEADNRPTPSVNYIEEEEVKYEPKPDLISFTVASTVYQAEEGMTWEEYINSEYNHKSFILGSRGITVKSDPTGCLVYQDSIDGHYSDTKVELSHLIYSISYMID